MNTNNMESRNDSMNDNMNDNDNTQHSELEKNGAHMFVDGLLQTHFQTPLERERRIARLMNAIEEPRTFAARDWMKFVRQSGALIATAAVIALMFIIGPREVEASAQAKSVVTAEQKTRDRRVIFQLIPPKDRPEGPDFIGSLDIRDAKHLVMTIRQPDGTIEVRGRDGERYWMIDREGKLRDLPSDLPWPTWVQSPRGGLLVDMAEAVSQGLNDEWKWSRGDTQMENTSSKASDHLIATRVKNKPQEPNKIDVRINQATGLATHIEMWWPENPQPPHGVGGGDKAGPMRDGPMRDGPMNGEGRPPRRMDGDGGMGDGPRGPGSKDGPMRDGPRGPGSKDGPPPKGPKLGVPMGPPSKMILIVEPPITFDAAWFTPEKQLSINGK